MTVPLIDPDRLAARLDDPDLRIVDTRWYLTDPGRGRAEYEEAHLPGAVFCDLEAQLCGSQGPGRHPLPEPDEFTQTLGRLGIAPGHTVVAYDDSGGSVAARLWWMLRSISHPEALVLDGGWSAWREAGHPVTSEIPRIEPSHYPRASRWTGVVDVDQIRDRLGEITLVDARAPERYRGEREPIDPKAGHIPTALNRPHTDNVTADQRLRPPGELRAIYEPAGQGDAVVYCGSGVTACHDALAMVVAGLPAPLLYPGSWSDWSSHPDLPVALGETP